MASASPWKRTVPIQAVSMAALMDEQYAEKLQKAEAGDTPTVAAQEEGHGEDIDEELALALALSLSEAADTPSEEATATTAAVEDAVPAVTEPTPSAPQEELYSDFALALAMQEAEQRELERITEYVRSHQHQKVQLSFHGLVPDDVHARRLLRGDDADAHGYTGQVGDEGPREEGLGMATIKDGRRRKRGEMLRTRDGSVITKHDEELNSRMNALDMAGRLDHAGDLGDGGFRIPNRVFNQLKHDMRKGESFKGLAARGRVEHATRATQDGVLDPRTRLLLFKMLNKGLFSEVGGCVKTGKECNLYYAPTADGSAGVALKVFKTTLNEFSHRSEYIDADPRYKALRFNKQSDRSKCTLWAKKEMRNLLRMHRAGIPCPEPLEQKEHVLAMAFLGVDGWPSPQLREVKLGNKGWASCYVQVLLLVRSLFVKASLVHGDLSEYNVLWHEGRCVLIDVGQSVHIGHPRADEFLRADVRNCTDFFKRQGVKVVAADEDVLSFVRTGLAARQGEEDERSEEQMLGEVVAAMVGGQSFEAAVECVGMRIVQWKERGDAGNEEDEDDEEEEDEEEEEGVEEGEDDGANSDDVELVVDEGMAEAGDLKPSGEDP